MTVQKNIIQNGIQLYGAQFYSIREMQLEESYPERPKKFTYQRSVILFEKCYIIIKINCHEYTESLPANFKT